MTKNTTLYMDNKNYLFDYILILICQLLTRLYLLINPLIMAKYFPNLQEYQVLLTQLDSFGVVFGNLASIAFIMIKNLECKTSIIPMFLMGTILSSTLLTLLLSINITFQAIPFLLLFGIILVSVLPSVIFGLLSAIYIIEKKISSILILLFKVSFLKVFSIILLFNFIHSNLILILISYFISLIYLFYNLNSKYSLKITKELFSYDRVSSYKIILSENIIGFLRAITPFFVFLILASNMLKEANVAICLTYAFMFASYCILPVSSGIAVSLNLAHQKGIYYAQKKYFIFSIIPSLLLLILLALFVDKIFFSLINLKLNINEIYFIRLFVFGCMIGLAGHFFSLGIRYFLQSFKLALLFLFTETFLQLFILILLTQYFIGLYSARVIGYNIILYASVFSVLSAIIYIKEKEKYVLENSHKSKF